MPKRLRVKQDNSDLRALQLLCLPGDAVVTRTRRHIAWSIGDVAFVLVHRRGHEWYLERAGTLPGYEGQGLYKRLLKKLIACAREAHITRVVTDCTYWNVRSANGLYAAGFRMFTPDEPWAFKTGLYWKIDL